MGLFSDIGGIFGGNSAAKKLNKTLKRLAEENKYAPTDVSGPLGSGSFELGENDKVVGAKATLNPGLQSSFDSFGRTLKGLNKNIEGFDQTSFTNKYFDSIDRLESRREADAFSSLESRLFNSGGISGATEQQVRNFQGDLEQRRADRKTQAVFQSQNFFSEMLKQALGLEGGRAALGASAFAPLEFGANLGQIQQSGNLSAANLVAEGAGIKAGAAANTASSIGGIADDLFSAFGTSFFGGP